MSRKEIVFTEEAFRAEAEMTPAEFLQFHQLVQILEETGSLRAPFAEKIAGQKNLFALRVRKGGNYRVFYAYDDGTTVWLLNGYEKKSERIPLSELRRALQLKRKYGL